MADLFDALNGEYTAAPSRLSDDEVRMIRELYIPGVRRQVDLAEEFGVHQSEISRIVNRKRRATA